jgi:hypothetical protein
MKNKWHWYDYVAMTLLLPLVFLVGMLEMVIGRKFDQWIPFYKLN